MNSDDQSNLFTKAYVSLRGEGIRATLLKIVKYPFKKQHLRKNLKKIFSHADIEDRFTEIYKQNYWGSEESVSGIGSTLTNTENLREKLPELFSKFSIKSVFDAPCGDFNWMQHVIKACPLDYTGGDIVKPLVESHSQKYGNGKTKFVHVDLTRHEFPRADLMICRDCLFHLSYEDTKAVLQNFIQSDIKYLLTTTHVNSSGFANTDIKTGAFRLIDLFSAPYNFSKDVLFRIFDGHDPEQGREMCLWTRPQISDALSRFRI